MRGRGESGFVRAGTATGRMAANICAISAFRATKVNFKVGRSTHFREVLRHEITHLNASLRHSAAHLTANLKQSAANAAAA